MKKTRMIPVALLVAVLAVALLIPTVIMPTAAASTVTSFFNDTFEGKTVGGALDSTSGFAMTGPKDGSIVNDNGNKVIKVPMTPYYMPGDSDKLYVRCKDASGSTKQFEVIDSQVTVDGVSYPVVDGAVTIGGTIYTVYNETEYELNFGGPNVDKNVTVSNGKMDYATEDKVYLQAEYYISEDAKGSVQMQMYSYSYVPNTGGERVNNGSWYSVCYLKLDDGGLKTDFTKEIKGVFQKGAWNTLTAVINLDSGEREFYANGKRVIVEDTEFLVQHCENSTTIKSYPTEITFNSGRWIIAKPNKTSLGLDSVGGYIYIDNAKAATCLESDLYTAPAVNEKGEQLLEVGITLSSGRSYSYPYEGVGFDIFCGDSAIVTPSYFNDAAYRGIVAPVKGASVRLTHAAGMRYATQLDLDLLDSLLALKKDNKVSNVSIGTLIAPRKYVEQAGAFTVEALRGLEGTNTKYIDVKGTIGAYYQKLPAADLLDGYDRYFVGSLTNIKLGNRAADFAAVGYVKVTLRSGVDVYIYSYEYDEATIGDYSRSVKRLAQAALNDPDTEYTAEQKVLLAGFLNGATNVTLNSLAVQDVQYTPTELFFRNGAGVYCRLTYEGKNGWRLQANDQSYNSFDETGAGQALSMYLGEAVESKTELLTIAQSGDSIVVSTQSGTYAVLSTGSAFALSFYTSEGALASNVTSVETGDTESVTSSKTVTLRGGLEEGEAVYGGGERFDVVNKRGTAFTLYTEDGWNKTNTTYMAIPLFVTTRGSGMFVNRYERMTVDFGKTLTSEWSVTIDNDMIDCYFYATGKMSDALLGYTELTGHSSLPEEWGQGELICRYSPDLKSFEDVEKYTTPYASYKDIPEFNSYGVFTVYYTNYYSIPNRENYTARVKGYSAYTEIPNYGNLYVKAPIVGYVKIADNVGTSYYSTIYSDKNGTVAYTKTNGVYVKSGDTAGVTTGTLDVIYSSKTNKYYDMNTIYNKADGTEAFVIVNNRYVTLDNTQGLTYLPLKDIEASGIALSNLKMENIYALAKDLEKNEEYLSSSANGMYVLCNCGDEKYLANHYYKMGAKGNHAGLGVESIVTNLINAGMKPTAMVLEPWGTWGQVASSEAERQRLKEVVDWLEYACKSDKCTEGECTCTGIKTMLYMGVAGIGSAMKGYKEEYQLWATFAYDDGTVKETYKLPRISGSDNPDAAGSSTQNYLDVTNPEAVEWYMNVVWGALIDIGVDGIKIDFCETMPDEGTYSEYKYDKNGNVVKENGEKVVDKTYTLTYNWYDDSVFEGDAVHHAYSTYFISIFYKSMIEQKEAKNIPDGFIVLSRGGGIGSQRNPYLWEGDQARTFEKIEDQLIALINSGISGVPFMTYDMAGYAYSSANQHNGNMPLEKESEIFARAIEYTAFTSNIQTHGDVRHAYEMTEETQEIYRRFTALHEELIPYIQKYSKEACRTGMPVVRAMVLEFANDVNVYNLETQYMFGAALLVAPVTTEATYTKDVYLPMGTWRDLLTGETYTVEEGGMYLTVDVTLGQIPVFMKTDCSETDNNLLAEVFNGETWQLINGGVALNIEIINPKGDPWLEDVFDR